MRKGEQERKEGWHNRRRREDDRTGEEGRMTEQEEGRIAE